jgi:small subunit ribosomal protein S23
MSCDESQLSSFVAVVWQKLLIQTTNPDGHFLALNFPPTTKMVRRIASQVHKQAARLMRANYIKNEPVWFQAVLEHPPLPLPPRAPPVREDTLLPSNGKGRKPKTEPLPIVYLEDSVRRQFFRDHPFEAFRPLSIVEGREVEDEHPVRGEEWTRLAQRGLNPSPEE